MNKRTSAELRPDRRIRPSSGASMGTKLLILAALFASQLPLANAVDYYIDPLSTGTGTGPDAGTINNPWKSLAPTENRAYGQGDRILLRRNRNYTGRVAVHIGTGGTANNPIIVGAYGPETEPRPIINAGGVVDAAIVVKNINYVTVQDIEVSNWASTPAKRDGIRINVNAGTSTTPFVMQGIKVKNCKITQVHGYTQRDRGVNVPALYDNAGLRIISDNIHSRFNNLVIEGNQLDRNNCIGILMKSPGYSMTAPATWSTNVLITDNHLDNGGADHILVQGADAPVVEYNTGYRAGAYGTKGYVMIAGMWVCWQTRNSLFRYNEVAHTFNEFTNGANGDSQAFDVDYGTTGNHIFQYNYTHHNQGGVLIVMPKQKDGVDYEKTVVYRYNLSVNDGRNTAYGCGFNVWPVEGKSQTHVHNNVVYTDKAEGIKFSNRTEAYYSNNVFHTPSAIYPTGPRFSHNAYFNHVPQVNDPYKVVANPMFAGPNFPQGVGADGFSSANYNMFKLQATSPCINAGKTISIPGVAAPTEDFWQNGLYVGRPDIGIHEHPTPTAGRSPAPTTTPTTVYENNSTGAVTRSTNMVSSTNELSASGNSLSRASTGGQWLQVAFTGDHITLYGKRGPSLGKMNVFINDSTTSAAVVDCYWPSVQYRTALHTVTGLPTNQTNTVRFTLTGTKNSASTGYGVGLDYFEKYPVTPPTPPVVTIIDDQAGTAIGTWDRYTPEGEEYYAMTRSISSTVGNTLTFNFYGTGVRLFAPKGHDRGIMDIQVDTRPPVTVNQFSPVSFTGHIDYEIKQFEVTDLPLGNHTLKVTVKESGGKKIVIDWIEALVGAASPVKIDTDASLTTTGAWSHGIDAAYYNGTKSVSNSHNASIQMTFTGTKARLYVKRGPNLGKLNMTINGTTTLVDCHHATTTFGYMIFESPTLPQGTYTLKATVYDPTYTSKYVGLDYFEYLP